MDTMTDTVKPPPIVVGVQGFVATTTKADEVPTAPALLIDWEALTGLPAFQMFVAEKKGGEVRESPDFYAEYCDWHEAKGYWPNETPMGRLIGGGV
jgi:hypothetical protein